MKTNNFPSRVQQMSRAQLVHPYFTYLLNNPSFREEVESLRIKYGIKKQENRNQLLVLKQEFWDPTYDGMLIVKRNGDHLEGLWISFHKEIEMISNKFGIKQFPILVKEYLLTGRFGDLFFSYNISCGGDYFNIVISRGIKKEDFDKIWLELQKYNKKYPQEESIERYYSDEILKKYEFVKLASRKYDADKKNIISLIGKEVTGYIDEKKAKIIADMESPKRSRLKKITREILSLLDDLNNAKF